MFGAIRKNIYDVAVISMGMKEKLFTAISMISWTTRENIAAKNQKEIGNVSEKAMTLDHISKPDFDLHRLVGLRSCWL